MKRRALLLSGVAAAPLLPTQALAADTAAALVAAAEAGNLAELRRQLEAGTRVDARDARGRSALLAATQADRVEAAKLLIARGADVNAKDDIATAAPR